MKKSLVTLLLCTASLAAADSVTLHDITFSTEVTAPSSEALFKRGWTLTNELLYFADQPETVTACSWTNGSNNTIKGLYFGENTGLRVNGTSSLNTTYLYLDSGISFTDASSNISGQLTTNQSGLVSITIRNETSGSAVQEWIDINANYGACIDTSNMRYGSIYLNEHGALTSAVQSGYQNKVYATLLTGAADVLASDDYDTTENADGTFSVTRTLFTGDFSGWDDAANKQYIYLTGVKEYTINATTEGLSVTYNIVPEPATATLSLLALAGLAARRRRH